MSSTAVDVGGKSMDGSGIFGQSAAAESEAKTDPNPVDKAARAETQATPPARAAANDDDGGSPLPGEDLPVQADLPAPADLPGAEPTRDEFQRSEEPPSELQSKKRK